MLQTHEIHHRRQFNKGEMKLQKRKHSWQNTTKNDTQIFNFKLNFDF